jgi:hypothetical protein
MTDEHKTEAVELPAEPSVVVDLKAPIEEPWRVLDGLADFRELPPLTPTPPTTHLPFPTQAEPLRRDTQVLKVEPLPVAPLPSRDAVRNDTTETPAIHFEAVPTAPRPPPPRPSHSADEQRRIATVLQLEAIGASPTTEVRAASEGDLPSALLPKTEERWLMRLVVGALVVVVLVFVGTTLWPSSTPPPRSLPPPRVTAPPPPPPPAPPVQQAPLDEWSLDPALHRVDTLAVHAPDLPTQVRHRYLLSVAKVPSGAVVAARLDDAKAGFGQLFGLVPGRVLAVHGVKAVRLHCEPPSAFSGSSTMEVQLVDTSTKETRLISLRPSVDCLDLGAGRALRITEPLRLALPMEPRKALKVAYAWKNAAGDQAAGMVSPGQTVRLEPGLVQIAVVSHSVSDAAPVRFELAPADVEAPQHQVQYLTPSLAPVREAPAPRPQPKPVDVDIWPPAR